MIQNRELQTVAGACTAHGEQPIKQESNSRERKHMMLLFQSVGCCNQEKRIASLSHALMLAEEVFLRTDLSD